MTAPRRPLRVARMLLRSGQLCLLLAMSACVLPIAPEFQDPPAAANYAPFFQDSDPPIGTRVTAAPDKLTTFTLRISDPNLGDNLHVRFISDFPPFTSNTRVLQPDLLIPHHADGTPLSEPVSQIIGCQRSTLSTLPSHQIMAIVADRGFLDSPPPPATPDLGLLPSGGLKAVAVWILDQECP
jgi:hypothetical protein